MATTVEDGEVTALDHFLTAVQRVSSAELDRRLEAARRAEESRQQDVALYDGLLDRLVTEVSSDYLALVEKASKEGDRRAELFVFDGSEKFEEGDHSILFLTKGPRRQGQDFFLRLGLLPFLPRLYQTVRPFDVDLQYLPESNENIVSITW